MGWNHPLDDGSLEKSCAIRKSMKKIVSQGGAAIPRHASAVWVVRVAKKGDRESKVRRNRPSIVYPTWKKSVNHLRCKKTLSRWIFLFSPRDLGKISILTNIFQLGWNHQLVNYTKLNWWVNLPDFWTINFDKVTPLPWWWWFSKGNPWPMAIQVKDL